jgi:hypothetical protein
VIRHSIFGLVVATAAAPRATSPAPNPALYTLLGVAITAVVSLAALFIKNKLDAESAKRQREHELAVLRIKVEQERASEHAKQLRQTYAAFLTGTANIYQDIVKARRARRDEAGDDDAYRRMLKAIQPSESQAALEEIRLLSADRVAEHASSIWRHLRSTEVASGVDLSSQSWVAWKEEYWRLRAALVAECKASLSVD